MQYHALLAATALLLLGCQQAAPPRGEHAAAPAAAASAATELRAEGDALMRAGDHQAAVARYRRALTLEPDDVTLRFALATAYTFLDRRPEAIEQFKQVVARGEAGSVESREARRWLAAARVPAETALVGPTPGPNVPATGPDSPVVGGRLVGSTEWPNMDPTRAIRGELTIVGTDGATEGVKRSRPLRLGGRYHFYDIPPGQYQLIARMANHPEDVTLWDQKVMVADGKPTEVTLTPATARISPDKFPPPFKE